MGLMLPRHQFSQVQHNLASTPAPTVPGTTVAAHATINTKGSWVQLFASANFDVHGITLMIVNDSVLATQVANLYDIGVGGAAAEVAIISNFLNTSGTAIGSQGLNTFFLPIYIPKGTRISARKQSNVTIQTSSIVVFLHGGGDRPPWKSFAGADGIGIDTADSGGTTHTPGSTGTESTWANIGSTLARDYGAIMPLASTGSDLTMTSMVGHLEIGIASITLAEYVFGFSSSEYITGLCPRLPIFGHFPLGTQMMIRAEVSGTTDDNYEFALLGFY